MRYEKDTPFFDVDVLQALLRHGKSIWDGIKLLCELVPDSQADHQEIYALIGSIEANPSRKASFAKAILKVLEHEEKREKVKEQFPEDSTESSKEKTKT